jgi:hypothetical protein
MMSEKCNKGKRDMVKTGKEINKLNQSLNW